VSATLMPKISVDTPATTVGRAGSVFSGADRMEIAKVVLCQEDAQASCCARDGGTGAALQEETAMSC